MLLICGLILAHAVWEATTGVQVWQTEPIGFSGLVDICGGLAVLAAIAAIVLGILGLADIRRGVGKVEGRVLAGAPRRC
jgi:hypothetical protein